MTNSRKPSLPDERNESEDERSLFYVAVTRAKQELIVLDGGNCEFVSEFQNVPLTKKDIEHAFREELVAQEPKLRKWLEEASKAALTRFQYRFKKELEKASDVARKQNEATLGRLRSNITQTENAIAQLGTKLQKDLRAANANLLEGLIPVLDKFGELINNPPETTELNNTAADCRTFVESVRLAQNQLRDSLESYGLKSIEVSAGEIFNPTHHEEISSAIYSDEISADRIAKEEQLGYLLHNRVVRKTRVIISKKKQIADILLSRDFSEPVRFVTYERFYDLRHIETFKNEVRGLDSRGREVQLQRFNVLFAFSKEDMAALKSHIQRRRPIANQDLQPIEFISERFHVADDILKPVLVKRDAIEFDNQDSTVQFVTRSGHVLNGHLWNFDEDFLYMEINKKVVIVYRTGILQFKNLIWNEIAKAYKKGTPINGHITEHAKGGFRVKFGLLYGFLPKSEVESKTVRNLDSYLGKSFKMKVVKLSKSSNKIVLSRRAWLEETRTKLLNTLEVGQQVTGTVKNITTFGTFVDLGGIDGLIHKSEMAWKRIDHPSEMVSVGEEVEVKIIIFDRENEKISLSLKQLTNDPWKNVEEKYPVGSTVRGIVVSIVNYGAFVQLEEGIDGLIHISEMPINSRDALPSDIVNKDDEVEVTVLKISKDSRRISLRMIVNLQRPFEDQQDNIPPDISIPIEEIMSAIPDVPPEPIITKTIEKTEDNLLAAKELSLGAETESATLYESTDSIDIKPAEEVVDTSPPMSEEFSAILKSQIEDIKLKTLEIEASRESLKVINDNSHPTPQESNEIFKKHVQNLKPALPEENADPSTEIANNTPGQPTKSTHSESPEKASDSSSNIETLHEEKPIKDEIQDTQRNLGHYLYKFGRFVVKKLKQE